MHSLRERIVDLIYKVITDSERPRRRLTLLFGFIFSSIVFFLIISSFYIDRFLGFPGFIARPLSIVVSLPVLIPGLILWLWSAGKFFQSEGTPVPVNPPPKLITDGPYAYSRNPMMTGLFLAMAGVGIFFGSITLTFIMTPLFVLMSILEFKNIEEPELEKRFGKEYKTYKEKTPIMIPKIFK
jgi:protein-S-isoprenylcysteine O-methyltransferase Ste14